MTTAVSGYELTVLERDYLLDRIVADQRHDSALVGLSSTAMVVAAMTGDPVGPEPLDVFDLNRCERTYERAPEHLQQRMWPILERFRALVLSRPETWHKDAVANEYRPAATRSRSPASGGDT